MNYEFSYLAPKSKNDLISLLSDEKDDKRLLAGGTDILVNIRLGLVKPRTIIDIKKIPEHKKISYGNDGLSIGPAVTISDVIENKIIQRKYPALIKAASNLASIQIRNRATVIGNICNASPCADMALPLLCLGAKVVLSSANGKRVLPLPEFFKGVKQTTIRPDEYCEKIIVPKESSGYRSGFKKLKRIKGHDIGLISVCLVTNGKTMRISIGSAAPTPVLLKEFSTSDSEAKIWNKAKKRISPIDDVRCSKDYRIFMARVYIRRLLEEVLK